MRLYYRLLTGYLILLLIMIVPCAVSIYYLSSIEKVATDLAKRNVELSTTVEYLRGVLPSIEAESRRYVSLYREDAYSAFLKLSSDYKKNIKKIEEKSSGPVLERAENLSLQLESIKKLVKKAHDSARPNISHGMPLLSSHTEDQIKALTSRMLDDLNDIDKILKQDLRDKTKKVSESTSRAKKLTTLITLAALGLALLIPWLLYKYIKRPIDNLRAGALAIGRGQFDQAIPVETGDELGQLAGVFNDMTRRLKELDQLKSDFIAVASHELKTPLSSMIEAAKLLNEPMLGALNEKQQRLVTILNESMGKFKNLIEELLDLSRMQAGLSPISRSPANMPEIISEVIATLSPLANSRSIQILTDIEHQGEKMHLDRDRMVRAIMNIVQNAIKYSPEGEKVKIILRGVHKDKKGVASAIEIGVIDTGTGISPEEQDKIFDKFYQIQTIRRKGGIGLGLAIAREIIQAHGGKIWVESPPNKNDAVTDGKGAAFWIQLSL